MNSAFLLKTSFLLAQILQTPELPPRKRNVLIISLLPFAWLKVIKILK